MPKITTKTLLLHLENTPELYRIAMERIGNEIICTAQFWREANPLSVDPWNEAGERTQFGIVDRLREFITEEFLTMPYNDQYLGGCLRADLLNYAIGLIQWDKAITDFIDGTSYADIFHTLPRHRLEVMEYIQGGRLQELRRMLDKRERETTEE